MQLILASTSAYRKTLLARLGVPFECISPNFDESLSPSLAPASLVEYNSRGKAAAVAKVFPGACIIASDQIALCEQRALGKPGNFTKAAEQLRQMSGKRITFLTGLAVYHGTNRHYECIPYDVEMRQLSDQEISTYLEREQPFDCAGSFKSEGLGIALFERMCGDDPTALIGLPLIRLSQIIKPLNIEFF